MKFFDILSLAFRTIRGNKLRTGLTISIIAFGIMALIGIITAIDAMNQKLSESFSTMGANAFTIRFREMTLNLGAGREATLTDKNTLKQKKSSLGKRITQEEAELFAERFTFPAKISLSIFGGRNNSISFGNKKTNPNVTLFGGDEDYLVLNGFELIAGRNISQQDVTAARNVCILGYDVAKKLFGDDVTKAVNAIVRIRTVPYYVTGVLGSKGSTFGFSRDNIVISTYTSVGKNFPAGFSFVIAIMTNDLLQVQPAMGEAEGVFRSIRKLSTTEDKNFSLDRSDSLASKAMNSLRFLTISAVVIGFITLIGAAIGLMNIMLVAVSERTREVGLIKAIGGKSSMITRQFLFEAIIISLAGAGFGITLGILVGYSVSVVLSTGFSIPWDWVLYGIIICMLVGILAGTYPALKAGKLDPIEALRYE